VSDSSSSQTDFSSAIPADDGREASIGDAGGETSVYAGLWSGACIFAGHDGVGELSARPFCVRLGRRRL
jgi:hypothetical protein